MHQFGRQRAWTGPRPFVERGSARTQSLLGTAQKPAIAGEIETFAFETAARIVIGRHDVMARHTATLSAHKKPAIHDPRVSIPWKVEKVGEVCAQ